MTVPNKRARRSEPGPTTLRSIAKLANCSVMTVSRALNGTAVSAEIAARIADAVDELGYVPNAAAQRLRGGRTKTIGALINVDFDPRTEVMAALDCLIREMERGGNQVLLSFARGGPEQIDTQLGGFLSRGVDGLFFWNAVPSPLLDRFATSASPVVAVGYRDDGCSSLPLVTLDAAPVFNEIHRRMEELGHRRAVELTSRRSPAFHETYTAFNSIAWERCDVGFARRDLVDFVSSVSSDPSPPTLVMGDYPRAVELLGVCEEMRVAVPDDLSVISFVDAVGAPLLRTPLSSIRTDYEAIGLAASRLMLSALDGAAMEDVVVPDAMRWIERASTGPAALLGAVRPAPD